MEVQHCNIIKGTPEWDAMHTPSITNNWLISASSVASILGFGFTPRSTYFRDTLNGERKKPSEYLQNMLDYGDKHEPDAWRAFLANGDQYHLWHYSPGSYFKAEPTIGDLVLAATPDGAVFNGLAWHMVELKCPSRGIPDFPPLKYILQMQIQLHCFRTANNDRAYWGKLFFWEPTRVACWTIEYSATAVQLVACEVQIFRDELRAGKLTEKTKNSSSRLSASIGLIEKLLLESVKIV